VDFDEFPSTPTLDQLGLSGQTMAVVGDSRMMLDSEGGTDSEQPHLTNRNSFISSSSMGMSSPRHSLTLHSDPKSTGTWSTPKMKSMEAKPNESSPYPYGSPLVHAVANRDDLL